MAFEQTIEMLAERRLGKKPFQSIFKRQSITPKKRQEYKALEDAAEIMSAHYASDPELTAFCDLDGEEFYEAR